MILLQFLTNLSEVCPADMSKISVTEFPIQKALWNLATLFIKLLFDFKYIT